MYEGLEDDQKADVNLLIKEYVDEVRKAAIKLLAKELQSENDTSKAKAYEEYMYLNDVDSHIGFPRLLRNILGSPNHSLGCP